MTTPRTILIINGSLRGQTGNCSALARLAESYAAAHEGISVTVLTLAELMPAVDEVQRLLLAADAFLVLSGVYWNSWSSLLQRFIEVATVFENGPEFFGKPVACGVTMDAVGGADVAARIHAAFAGLGCWSPPCASLVISRVGEFAVAQTLGTTDDPNEDVWRVTDLEIVIANLVSAAGLRGQWVSWDKLSLRAEGGAWPESGGLDLGSPRFL